MKAGRDESQGGDADMDQEQRSKDPVFEDGSRAERRRAGHVDRIGRPRMADVSDRPATPRRAVAEAEVMVSQQALSGIVDGTMPKGDVLSVAELAGVMAAKRTAELIPLSHSTVLTELLVSATPERGAGLVRVRAETAALGQTGVEMQALTAAAIAALTVYDMVRDVDRSAAVGAVRLVSASNGEPEAWRRAPAQSAASPRAPHGARAAGRIAPASQHGSGGRGGRPQPHRRAP